jgi:hypothetical protein
VLKADVLAAVTAAREAVQDLATEVSVTKRTPAAHVPGTPPVYTKTVINMKLVIVDYTEKEIDGERIRVSDQKGILFPMDGRIDVNDTIAFNSREWRVLSNKPTLVGTDIAVNTLQLRPT